jgi:hypothetical protein
LELHRKDNCVGLVDGDDHETVTQPFGDANPAFRGDIAGNGPKRGEQLAGGVVAVHFREMREPGKVDEGEGAGDAHAPSGYAK